MPPELLDAAGAGPAAAAGQDTGERDSENPCIALLFLIICLAFLSPFFVNQFKSLVLHFPISFQDSSFTSFSFCLISFIFFIPVFFPPYFLSSPYNISYHITTFLSFLPHILDFVFSFLFLIFSMFLSSIPFFLRSLIFSFHFFSSFSFLSSSLHFLSSSSLSLIFSLIFSLPHILDFLSFSFLILISPLPLYP